VHYPFMIPGEVFSNWKVPVPAEALVGVAVKAFSPAGRDS